jgi:hypothetical protein
MVKMIDETLAELKLTTNFKKRRWKPIHLFPSTIAVDYNWLITVGYNELADVLEWLLKQKGTKANRVHLQSLLQDWKKLCKPYAKVGRIAFRQQMHECKFISKYGVNAFKQIDTYRLLLSKV